MERATCEVIPQLTTAHLNGLVTREVPPGPIPRFVHTLLLFDWFRGCRVGEAKNPGPGNEDRQMTFTILNPTTLPDRYQDIIAMESDCISLVETSATQAVQSDFSKFLKTTDYRISWGPPVPSHRVIHNPFSQDKSLRGAALGTASLHRTPRRNPRIPLPSWLEDTMRVSQQIVTIGHIEILLVTAYFYAGRTHDIKNKSDILLAELYQVCATTNLPFLIAADFNNPVQEFPAFRAFEGIRCQEAFQLAQLKFNKQLPPTCRNSTRNDSFIIHESLLSWVTDIWVGEPDVFPDHRPLFLQFRFPEKQCVLRNWFLPQSWGELKIDPAIFQQKYLLKKTAKTTTRQARTHESVDFAFERWSKDVEAALKATIKEQHSHDPIHFPTPAIGKKFFGRCRPTRFTTQTAPKTIKHDPTQAYEPPTEVTSCKARLKVRQVRRIASLLRHCQKSSGQPISDTLIQQLQQEWNAIKQAQGYGRSWVAWLLSFEFVPFVPETTPSIEWLHDALNLTRFDSDAYARQELQLRRHHKRHAIAYAISHTNKAYQFIRGKEQKFLHDLPIVHSETATLCRSRKGKTVVRVNQPMPIPVGSTVVFGKCKAVVSDNTNTRIVLDHIQGNLPAQADLEFHSHAYTIQPMSDAFHRYWSQFWLRDSSDDQDTDEPWEDLFHHLDEAIPTQDTLDIQIDDPRRLKETIQRLKPFKAIGVDGWHAEELQSLTWDMICDLSTLLSSIWAHGHSFRNMQARTLLVAKKERPESISDGRPITILGYLARLTSKLVSDQALHQWSKSWPPEISGGLPQRSARDLSLLQLFQIETAKAHRTAWCGWTMDLVKAFNLIPRRVIRHVFGLLGIPHFIGDFWFKSLRKLTRVLQCGNCIGPPALSTTGLPEGDSMSVVGMLALSYVFHQVVRRPRVFPFTYADNWSFMTTAEKDCFQTMITILNLVHDLRMQIDFAKSWTWATTQRLKQFWTDASSLLMRPGFKFTIKNHVHDLGCMIAYNNQIVLGPLRDKIDNAIAKCNRLRKLNLDLDERAEKIQSAIWPATFYGALGVPIGEKHFVSLRRAAANVLVGDHKHAASHVALHYLTCRVQDPLLYLIADMLTTLRRLFVYHPQMAYQFLTSARNFQSQVFGPATALASYLKKVGWEVTATATIIGPGGLRVNIRFASGKQIKKQLRIAWDWYCHQEIYHRKGVPECPFDSYHTHKLMSSLSDRQRRILALTMTSGWQSNSAMSLWNAQQSPKCLFCEQEDTHTHFFLECPAFSSIRAQHPEAVLHLSANKHLCWFPLPTHTPEVVIVRQAMHQRARTLHIQPNIHVHHGDVIYTDGSCDHPKDPYTARAAWAVVIRQNNITPNTVAYATMATGHCPGRQTINRAELYALLVAAEQALSVSETGQVTFFTDSQFVVKRDHWDLIERLTQVWQPQCYHLFKIKSHLQVSDARSHTDALNIQGNIFADEAAVRACALDLPEFSSLCTKVRLFYQQQCDILRKIYHYILEVSCERMTKLETKDKAQEMQDTANMPDHVLPDGHGRNTVHLQKHVRFLSEWKGPEHVFSVSDEPHRVVFWSCFWGCNFARLVWNFCQILKWPDPDTAPQRQDPGISWTELSVSFMLWANRFLPLRIRDGQTNIPVDYHDPRIQLQPIKNRSVRSLSETFRLIVKHIQTFGRTNIIPTYKKQGTSSLTRLGFSRYHEAGVSRRPQLPNPVATMNYLRDLILQILHNPPFHNEVQPLPIPPLADRPLWPEWPEILPAKREKFTQHIRCVMFRKKDLNTVVHPGVN